MNRRTFLETSSAALAGSLAFPGLVLGRRRPYRTALIGSGWWGMNILRTAIEAGQSQVVGLADVDAAALEAAAAEVQRLTGAAPRRFRDYRDLLAETRPEIVIVATPDHWHALAMIAAVEAGADVYVEKPISHTLNEGRAMVAAARKHGRVVQVGTHRRASPHCAGARDFIRSGKLGKIGSVRAFVHYGGGPGEPAPDAEPPAGLDWDFWCGPAPLRPFNPRLHPRGFRQYLDYANGQIGDWGIHWLDQILWIMDEEPYPHTVFSNGGRFIKQDGADAPDTQLAAFSFETHTVHWEHRQYGGNGPERHSIGCYFYGTEGAFHLGWQDGWTFYPTGRGKQILHEDPQLHMPDQQNIRELWADFLGAVETRGRPVADIEAGHRATSMSLLGMLALKLGRSIRWDGEQEQAVGDPEANALLSRPYRAPWVYPRIA